MSTLSKCLMKMNIILDWGTDLPPSIIVKQKLVHKLLMEVTVRNELMKLKVGRENWYVLNRLYVNWLYLFYIIVL